MMIVEGFTGRRFRNFLNVKREIVERVCRLAIRFRIVFNDNTWTNPLSRRMKEVDYSFFNCGLKYQRNVVACVHLNPSPVATPIAECALTGEHHKPTPREKRAPQP